MPLPSLPVEPVPLPSLPVEPVPLPPLLMEPVPLPSLPVEPVLLPLLPVEPVPLPPLPVEPVPLPPLPMEPVPLPSLPVEPVPLPSLPPDCTLSSAFSTIARMRALSPPSLPAVASARAMNASTPRLPILTGATAGRPLASSSSMSSPAPLQCAASRSTTWCSFAPPMLKTRHTQRECAAATRGSSLTDFTKSRIVPHPCFGACTSRLQTIFKVPSTIALYPSTSVPMPIRTALAPFRGDFTSLESSAPSKSIFPSTLIQHSWPKRRSRELWDGMPHVAAGDSFTPPNGFDRPDVWLEATNQKSAAS